MQYRCIKFHVNVTKYVLIYEPLPMSSVTITHFLGKKVSLSFREYVAFSFYLNFFTPCIKAMFSYYFLLFISSNTYVYLTIRTLVGISNRQWYQSNANIIIIVIRFFDNVIFMYLTFFYLDIDENTFYALIKSILRFHIIFPMTMMNQNSSPI